MLDGFYDILGNYLSRFSWGEKITRHVARHRKAYMRLEAVVAGMILALAVHLIWLEIYRVPNRSMSPVLLPGDRLAVNQLAYIWGRPAIGDLVLLRTPEPKYEKQPAYCVRRIAGLPGQDVSLEQGQLHVNGERVGHEAFLQRRYSRRAIDLTTNRIEFFSDAQVPEGSVFVLGDNSEDFLDSRSWGSVPIGNLHGRVSFRFWPPGRIETVQ
jgi:signal peptidase I